MEKSNPALAGPAARVHEKGELAARTILGQWKGPALADACVAALQLGLLNAGNMLAYHRCRQLLDANLGLHKVNEDRMARSSERVPSGSRYDHHEK